MLTLNRKNPLDLAPPGWVTAHVGAGSTQTIEVDGLELGLLERPGATLLSVRCHEATALTPDRLEAATIAVYRLLRDTLKSSDNSWPVRIWNYIPGIHERLDAERDRYMVFNGGRYKAYSQWWGGPEMFREQMPTASGVGHFGDDLVVHCLAMNQPGIAIENPRQVPAFEYSKRYGPLPPCFARATLCGSELLVGGTASIRGEQSMFAESLEEQTSETLTNIIALVQAGCQRADLALLSDSDVFAAFSSVRVFFPNSADQNWIETTLQRRFSNVPGIEFVRADLCRPELLIEIEGVATLCRA